MKTATLVCEGTKEQAQVVAAFVRGVFRWINWKHVINYELADRDAGVMTALVESVREAWWPLARRLLQRCGPLDFDELIKLNRATDALDAALRRVLGNDSDCLRDRTDMYYVAGSIPIEWLLHDRVPICLYAPFYRFSKVQHVVSAHAPPEDGLKLFIAPRYSTAELAGVNSAVAESALWVRDNRGVVLLDGQISPSSLCCFGNRQFARLMFHGHATPQGLLASDGTAIPFADVLRLVRGPAFLLGCATGAFESGTLRIISDQIPLGLHGALVLAFPSSSEFTKRVNERVVMEFLRPGGGARRVQDITHMVRLALAYMGILYVIRGLAGITFISESDVHTVTPFEAEYDARFASWGAGVARLQEELRTMRPRDQEVLISTASAFAMSVVSC
ncbi:MAG TPA: hypothetical protein VMD76_09135, partial [Candidatus Sulfotelmatobacter sp.]|nr:hypothetical protein [Candidatus Sulfotelmatobacter sp.]